MAKFNTDTFANSFIIGALIGGVIYIAFKVI